MISLLPDGLSAICFVVGGSSSSLSKMNSGGPSFDDVL